MIFQEVQVTKGSYGHMLNSIQVFSPDDEWIVYDTRNDQTHISQTCCIEKVHVSTGEVVRLYAAPNQTLHGPGVGAPVWHPFENKVVFIHGLLNCSELMPYGFTRRFGALLDVAMPGKIRSAEARKIHDPLVAGALRGGTHAHSWSGDGKWISFTYNDFIMEKLEQSGSAVKDLRTIGVMSPARPVQAGEENAENFSGQFFSVVAATVTEKPQRGSEQIEKAFDECWVGDHGYIRKDGMRQQRAIAFQGLIRTKDGSAVTEIFVSDVPEDITASESADLHGTFATRPSVPAGLVQRRITFTENRKYPGLQGPRFWLRSAPDGSRLYFLMKDDVGIVQVYSVSVHGGNIRQVTRLETSVQAQFNVSPDGKLIALIADNSVWVCDIGTGYSNRLTPRSPEVGAPLSAAVWNKAGNTIVYNRYVTEDTGTWLQIFKIALN